MPWDRESNEEYDDGYTRESFERAEEDTEEDMEPRLRFVVVRKCDALNLDIIGPFDGFENAEHYANKIRGATPDPVWVQQLI